MYNFSMNLNQIRTFFKYLTTLTIDDSHVINILAFGRLYDIIFNE